MSGMMCVVKRFVVLCRVAHVSSTGTLPLVYFLRRTFSDRHVHVHVH